MSHTVFVVLGASNVTKALPSILQVLIGTKRDEVSLAIFVAHGPGRSYGQTQGVIGWRWPGHRESSLVDAVRTHLDQTKPQTLHVLATDIGNDIPYEVSVDKITSWVESLTRDFQELGARVAITSLPVESVLALPAWKFNIVRPLLFPGHPLSRTEAFDRIHRVQSRVIEIGAITGSLVLPTRAAWYGADHIHLRWKMHVPVFEAWIECLLECSTQDKCERWPWDDVAERSRSETHLKRRVSPWIRFARSFEEHRLGVSRKQAQLGLEIAPRVRLYLY